MTYDTKQLENLGGYHPKCNCGICAASVPPATLGRNTPVIRPETKVNKIEDASQHLQPIKTGVAIKIPEPLECPEMDKNTKLIVEACKQVVRSDNDYEHETFTTPVTVVQACERLNCVIERIKAGV